MCSASIPQSLQYRAAAKGSNISNVYIAANEFPMSFSLSLGEVNSPVAAHGEEAAKLKMSSGNIEFVLSC